ncbi:MAG: hypothetical protein R8G66_25310 [Cytophagales bacterium]|nr:hypothetical protein [Cytophagales bacterium]
MKRITYLFTLLTLVINLSAQTLTKEWEVSGLEAPESAVFYNGNYYVSNVAGQPAEKNGLGYLTKIDKKGIISELKWLEGFNAPKGLAVYNNQLFVADIDRVAVVDLATTEIVKWYDAAGATFLNDVEVVNNRVFISDTFGGNSIYVIEKEEISLWLKDERLDYPNGLMNDGNKLLVASWGVVTDPATFGTDIPGKLIAVDLKTKKIQDVSSSTGNLDGLVKWKKNYIVSDWIAGGILTIDKKGNSNQILDMNAGSADLTYISEANLLLVPQMIDGKLTAFSVK